MDWEEIKKKIKAFLVDYLDRIEWNYGECRAPFKYPPRLEINNEGSEIVYTCTLELDFAEENTAFTIQSDNPPALLAKVKKEVNRHFINFEEE